MAETSALNGSPHNESRMCDDSAMFRIMLILLGTLASASALAQTPGIPACGVELRVRPESMVVQSDRGLIDFLRVLIAELVNSGDDTVRLIQAGDGSGAGWRTPILSWSVSAGPRYAPSTFGRCGNINPLREGEVFNLQPGAVRRLTGWVPPLPGLAAGTYRLRLSYTHDPALKWQGLELGPHDDAEMQRVRASTPCHIESNEITLTVLAGRQ